MGDRAALRAEALEAIRGVARDELGLPRDPREGDDLVLDLHLDSVGLLTLVVALEDRFRLRLEEQDAAEVRTIGDLASLVADRAEGHAGSTRAVAEKAP